MKHSIRKQFTFVFIGMMAATIVVCWLLNILFLERYYTNEKKKNLLEVYETLNKAVASGEIETEEFYDVTMPRLCGRYNIAGIVIDVRTQEVTALGANEEEAKWQLWDNLLLPKREEEELLLEEKNYRMTIIKDRMSKTDYMSLGGSLESGDVFLLRTPLESIRDSVGIANRFLALMGVFSAIVSGLIIWMLTRKYTKPILELAKISERVAHLDFDARYEGTKNDEIGVLGENINFMSQELEKTISELKTANNELTRDIEKKEKLEEMRSEFISNVSHELKTPIALIQGYAEGLKDNILEDEAEKDFYCEVIMDESRKMNEMVKKLLTLNQLEFGNDTLSMERFDICTLVNNYLQSAEILLKDGIRLHAEQTQPIYVWGDEFKIEEVFTNYFSNAVNHVEARGTEPGEISISYEVKETSVRIKVCNTGKPIPEESLSKVWDKFYKVDKARTREYGGSGIGLSIVKAIMESVNQPFGVENQENGVCFWFELEKG